MWKLQSPILMDPKRKVRGGRKGINGGRKKPSQEMLSTGKTIRFFHESIRPMIREEIERVERDLWNRVHAMHMKTVKAKVEELVTNPGTILRRLSAYEWMVTTLWFTKKTSFPHLDG